MTKEQSNGMCPSRFIEQLKIVLYITVYDLTIKATTFDFLFSFFYVQD